MLELDEYEMDGIAKLLHIAKRFADRGRLDLLLQASGKDAILSVETYLELEYDLPCLIFEDVTVQRHPEDDWRMFSERTVYIMRDSLLSRFDQLCREYEATRGILPIENPFVSTLEEAVNRALRMNSYILLDFAGEDNSRRTCNYGLTETGKQALRKAADPSIPHTYAWFVMTDTNTPQEIIRQDLTLEEAIQIYQDSNTSEKRLGVIKDGIATVDFVHFQSGEQQFFTDHEKLESFRSDLVVAEAMERLYQQLNQPDIGIRMGEM